MNPAQISAVILLSCLAAAFFHFSGYTAGRGCAKNGDWTTFGAMPLIMVTVGALISLISFVIHTFVPLP